MKIVLGHIGNKFDPVPQRNSVAKNGDNCGRVVRFKQEKQLQLIIEARLTTATALIVEVLGA